MKRSFISETTKHIDEMILVAGWVNTVRSHGKLLFIDLRDRSGIVQVVFGSGAGSEVLEKAKELRPEWVVQIIGEVKQRPKGMENPDLPTGSIEISAKELTVLSRAKTLPFAIDSAGYEISEEKRLKYRYLDLRRARLQKNLRIRHKVIMEMREFLCREGFIEIETPILTKSTPEGARDFLVPSRLQPGKFYALPQSPQQYKQLLQVAGFERYFQIARCFRDEDPRADRQAEFTQLDIEMSFVEQEDILDLIERLYSNIIQKIFPEKKITQKSFPRLTYKEVMENYGTDKPDLRQNPQDPNELAFAFVVDFPMFEWRKEEKRWDAVHHPFTKIQNSKFKIQNSKSKIQNDRSKFKIDNSAGEERFIQYIKKNPQELLAFQYDFVLNGYEIGGGSIREHNPKILEAVFEVMGHKKADIKAKFGHLLEAFFCGVPPHGGIAPGIDRFLAVVLNELSIREVMAFPKTGDNRDLMMGAPSEVSKEQLKELHLKFTRGVELSQ